MKSVLATFLLLGGLAYADNSSSPAGTVSSSDAFTLDNVAVNAKGVASWPIMGGDSIQTSANPVLVTLNDGTQIRVDPNSKIKIMADGPNFKVVVISGSIEDWKHKHWCWSDSASKTSNHKCGDGDHDSDDRCCPGK